MEQDQKTRDREAEPKPHPTDRREFLRKSLHAGPILLTAVHDGSLRGVSVQGTLWSSAGTDWTHRRRWWHGRDRERWEDPRPPDVGDFPEPPGRQRQRTRPADDEWEWRHWRAEPGENDKPEWDWGYLRPEDEPPEDVPADPSETPPQE